MCRDPGTGTFNDPLNVLRRDYVMNNTTPNPKTHPSTFRSSHPPGNFESERVETGESTY